MNVSVPAATCILLAALFISALKYPYYDNIM